MSAASSAFQMDRVILDPNVPRELVLKYRDGKLCSNGNYLFSTFEGKLFLSEEDARTLQALGLGPNEPFRIVKRQVKGSGRNSQTDLIITRVQNQQQPEPSSKTTPAAASAEQANLRNPVAPDQDNSLSRILYRAYTCAIDTLVEAQKYAEARSVAFNFNEEDIRTSAHALFIEYNRRNGGAR